VTRRHGRRRHDERGQAAGLETIPLGVLVFVGGTLLVVNAWAIVANRATADSLAREYLRAYTKETSRPAALAAGQHVVDVIADGRHLRHDRVRIDPPTQWAACAPATVTVHLTVPEVRAPFLGGFGSTEIVVTHRDRLDGYRAGLPLDPGGTACD
jgi:hypothetical protein